MAQKELPPDLVRDLQRLDRELRIWLPSYSTTKVVASGLRALPASDIQLAARRVPELLALYPAAYYKLRKPGLFSWLRRLMPRPPGFREMLSTYPDLALPFTFHDDGFVREVAVRMIASQPVTPFSIAAALYRVNDWVKPIRETAARSVETMLGAAPPRAGAEALLTLILESARWGRWGRFREELFLPALARPEVAGQIAITIRDSERGRMSAILRQLLILPVVDDMIEDLAANARIASVRVVATDALIHRRARWPTGNYRKHYVDSYPVSEPIYAERPLSVSPPLSKVLIQAAADRAAIVRKAAADALIRNLADAETAKTLIAMLKDDRDKSIRERIAFVLRQAKAPGPQP